ncbi:hypothetical protein GGI35DRAFT_492304 [Trichoderma velutinum]
MMLISSLLMPTMKRHPEIPPAERCRIVSVVKGINKIIRRQSDLENFKFPPPTTEPIPYLEPPRSDGMKCRTYPHIACQIQKIQAHCRKKHNWINPRKKGRQPALQPLNQDEAPWTEGVLCQRFFRSRAASCWFEVGRGHTHSSQIKSGSHPDMLKGKRKQLTDDGKRSECAEAETHLNAVLTREKQRLEENNQPAIYDQSPKNNAFASSNPWMDRTQWDQIYKGTRRDILQALIRLPNRHHLTTHCVIGQRSRKTRPAIVSLDVDEQKISCLLGALDCLLDRCEDTVRNTSRHILCWLHSTDHQSCSRKPFSLVSKVGSKKRYRRLWKCLIAFLTNVPLGLKAQNQIRNLLEHEAWEHIETRKGLWPDGGNQDTGRRHAMPTINEDDDCTEDDMSFSDMEDTEDSADEHDNGTSDADINSLSHGNSNSDKEKTEGFEECAQPDFDCHDSSTMPDQIIELLLQLSLTLMTERFADGQPSSTLLVYFSGILGFTACGKGFKPAKQYTTSLSGLIFIQRLLFLEYALPLHSYLNIGIPQRPRFGQHERLELIRKEYVITGSQSPFDELHSLRNFGRVIARTDPFLLRWSDDGATVSYGDSFHLSMNCFRRLADYFITEAEELCSSLMLGLSPNTDLVKVKDDLTNGRPDYSFTRHPDNGLDQSYLDLVEEACKSPALSNRGHWNWAAISSYQKRATNLQEMLLGAFYTACGQAPRAEDLLTVDCENGEFTKCSIYIWNGSMVYIVRTHKALLRREQLGCLADDLKERPQSHRLFSTDGQPWEPNRLTLVLKKATTKAWGRAINIQVYRQITIGVTEKHVREIYLPFNQYDDRGSEADLNVIFAWQSGHRPLQRGITYGLDGAYPSRLQPSLLRAYEWASFRWHEFLHLASKITPCPSPQLSEMNDQALGKPRKRKISSISFPIQDRAAKRASNQAGQLNKDTQDQNSANLMQPHAPSAFTGLEKEEDILHILPEHQIILCLICKTAIQPGKRIKSHLQKIHSIKGETLKKLIQHYSTLPMQDPTIIPLPENGSQRIPQLQVYNGFQCKHCPYLTINHKNVIHHCSQQGHNGGEASKQGWDHALLQTFTNRRWARYWIIYNKG